MYLKNSTLPTKLFKNETIRKSKPNISLRYIIVNCALHTTVCLNNETHNLQHWSAFCDCVTGGHLGFTTWQKRCFTCNKNKQNVNTTSNQFLDITVITYCYMLLLPPHTYRQNHIDSQAIQVKTNSSMKHLGTLNYSTGPI